MGRKSLPKAATTMTAPTVRIYTLEVSLLRIPAAKTSGEVLRTIQIRGDQTLAVLHQSVCDAFCRDCEQQYEFQLGTAPMDPEGPRYVLAGAFEVSVEDGTPAAGRVDNTELDALKLEVGQSASIYWIDCGEDWWHQIHVTKIENKVPRQVSSKMITRRARRNSRLAPWTTRRPARCWLPMWWTVVRLARCRVSGGRTPSQQRR